MLDSFDFSPPSIRGVGAPPTAIAALVARWLLEFGFAVATGEPMLVSALLPALPTAKRLRGGGPLDDHLAAVPTRVFPLLASLEVVVATDRTEGVCLAALRS
jgi:hypothetical protein